MTGRGSRFRAGEAGTSVASAGIDHPRPGCLSRVRRAVGTAAIGDNDLPHQVVGQLMDDTGDCFGFIESRDYDADQAGR